MWYSSRGETDGGRVQPSMNTSTYLHRDVGYGIPSQTNRAQDVQRTFITPGHHRHVNLMVTAFFEICKLNGKLKNRNLVNKRQWVEKIIKYFVNF